MYLLCNLFALINTKVKIISLLCIETEKQCAMATNKNAQIRYKILDKCFRNTGRSYFIEDLMQECNETLMEIDPTHKGISRRQVLYDIAFMESTEGWEIDLLRVKEGRRVAYRYADPHFSIHNMPLNETEINSLLSTLQSLSQFKGMPQLDWIYEVLPKLNLREKSEQLHAIIEFESNMYLKGIEYMGELYNAILYKKVLQVEYQPYTTTDSYQITLHPYFLKQYNNRWFVFGYNAEKCKYDWNIALDRIEKLHEVQLEYVDNTEIDWEEYFEDMYGVTKPVGKSVEPIILHFYGKTGHYIETKPIHGSQRANWIQENLLEVKLDLIINYELEQFILSYAESIKVIQPQSLASQIKDRLGKGKELYMVVE